jgi:hypothetical protein
MQTKIIYQSYSAVVDGDLSTSAIRTILIPESPEIEFCEVSEAYSADRTLKTVEFQVKSGSLG